MAYYVDMVFGANPPDASNLPEGEFGLRQKAIGGVN